MQKIKNKYLLCTDCQQTLEIVDVLQFADVNKTIPSYAIFKCKCQMYPLVKGILYLHRDVFSKKTVVFLKQRQPIMALFTLLNFRFPTLLMQISIFTSILSQLLSIILKYHLLVYIGFKNVMYLLTFISFSKNTSCYFRNRERYPSYYFNFLAANLIKNRLTRVIDIGCGPGQFFQHLGKIVRHENIYGIDKSFANLFLARIFFANSKISLICFDVDHGLPFISNYFDICLSNDFFHYLKNKRLFITELTRVSKTDGIIALLHISNKLLGHSPIKTISAIALKKLLKKCGYRDIAIYSDESLWDKITKNLIIKLNRPDSLQKLRSCEIYTVFAAKMNLPDELVLPSGVFNQIKKVNIITKDQI